MCRLGGKGGMRGGQTLTHKAGRNRRGSNATGGGGGGGGGLTPASSCSAWASSSLSVFPRPWSRHAPMSSDDHRQTTASHQYHHRTTIPPPHHHHITTPTAATKQHKHNTTTSAKKCSRPGTCSVSPRMNCLRKHGQNQAQFKTAVPS